MEQYDARIDAYIDKSADFAKPILKHIRQTVHAASPLITETIKWGMPFFDYKGTVCHMAAFKQHCAFGFWKRSLIDGLKGYDMPDEKEAMGSFGRLTSIGDLPGDEILAGFIQQAVELNEKDIKIKKAPPVRTELVVPEDFSILLEGSPKAKETFEKFSYSNKKEYLTWITEAKTDVTRQKRLDIAIEWLNEGKIRHWKMLNR